MTGLLPESWQQEGGGKEDSVFTPLCCLVNCGQFLCSFIAKVKDVSRSHTAEKLRSQDFSKLFCFNLQPKFFLTCVEHVLGCISDLLRPNIPPLEST